MISLLFAHCQESEMKRIKYSLEFERLWQAFDSAYGEKGSKADAYKQFLQLEINSEDVDFIITRYSEQKEIKRQQRELGKFSPNFQHVCRYIKNERFDDEISTESYEPIMSKRDAENAAATRQYLAGNMGKSMAFFDSNENGTGASEQLYISLLEKQFRH